jgi:hypothetical protein
MTFGPSRLRPSFVWSGIFGARPVIIQDPLLEECNLGNAESTTSQETQSLCHTIVVVRDPHQRARHMKRNPAPFPTALETFVALFNEEAFWESHEVLEGPWRETGSDFYHGMILYASAFVHVQRGNSHGIAAQLAKAERCLREFRPFYLGIDVKALLSHARQFRKAVQEKPDITGERWKDMISFPTIQLRAEHLLGDEREIAGSNPP